MTPLVHGSVRPAELRRLGLSPADVLDFSANVNPYGPSPRVRAAVGGAALDRYPDPDCLELTDALSEFLGVPRERILAGNGASELIALAALAFVRPGGRVLVLGPTYGEYARAASLVGGRVTEWRAQEADKFAFAPMQVATLFENRMPDVLFVCTPNNPTGTRMQPAVVADWAGRHPGTLFVIDEAYIPFVAGAESAVAPLCENVLVLRSMTKDFGLAGLRLGFAVGDQQVIARLRAVQTPWSVSAPAQAAGVAALADLDHRRRTLDLLARAKRQLTAQLAERGLAPLPSSAHFFLLRVGDGAAFRAALLRHGIAVRDCASFGLPEYVRIAARRPEENDRLLAALAEGV